MCPSLIAAKRWLAKGGSPLLSLRPLCTFCDLNNKAVDTCGRSDVFQLWCHATCQTLSLSTSKQVIYYVESLSNLAHILNCNFVDCEIWVLFESKKHEFEPLAAQGNLLRE